MVRTGVWLPGANLLDYKLCKISKSIRKPRVMLGEGREGKPAAFL